MLDVSSRLRKKRLNWAIWSHPFLKVWPYFGSIESVSSRQALASLPHGCPITAAPASETPANTDGA